MSLEEQLNQLPSDYKQQFEPGILKDASHDIVQILKNQQKPREHRISIRKSLPKQLFYTDLTPVSCSDTLNGAIVECTARIAYFTIQFNMIFIKSCAPKIGRCIGKGGGGSIYSYQSPDNGIQCAAKRIKISEVLETKSEQKRLEQHLKLKNAIMEYAIYRIADFFEIGPKVVNFGFDIVCYNDVVEFYLEKCEDIKKNEPYRLKYCVRVLHSLSITHRDIKPGNLLYSKTKGKLVLTDFGLSKAVKEKIGQLTNSGFCGTKGFCGDQMKKIQMKKAGHINLFKSDMQSTNLTIQNFQDQQIFEDSQSNLDYKPSSSAESEQQVSTTETSSPPSTPVEFIILNQIYLLYSKNKCLDLIEYDWIKFCDSLDKQQKQILNEMIGTQVEHKVKYLIYCYGYSSQLLEKIQPLDKQSYDNLKHHFEDQKVQVHLRNDFKFKFDKILNVALQLKYDTKSKKSEQIEQNKAKCIKYYKKLQFLIMNQFKFITYSQSNTINDLQIKMKKIKLLNSLDPVWDLAIMFIQSCVTDSFDKQREKISKQIISNLKYLSDEQPRKLFEHLIDMITLSFCSPSTVERVCIYSELILIQGFLSETQQLMNKSLLLKIMREKQSKQYKKLRQQITSTLKQLMINQNSQNKNNQKQLLTQCMAIYFYEEGEYSQSLKQYLTLKKNRLLQFGMSKQISPILNSIANCYYKLHKYKQVINVYKQIRRATGQVTAADYQVIGESYFKLGYLQRSRKYYSDCFNMSEDKTGKCEYWIGYCQMELMKWQNAIKYFENCLISKKQAGLVDCQYFEANIKIVECESYSLNKPLNYFESKYHKIIGQINNYLVQNQNIPLLIKIFMRLEILYQKYNQDVKRQTALSFLEKLKFNYSQDDLYQRAGIYYCSGMIQKSFIYSYASGLRLKIKIEHQQYVIEAIIQRKERISRLLQKKHKDFKTQFNCLRHQRDFILPDKKLDLEKSSNNNAKLKRLLPILEPFYLKQVFQTMLRQANQIGQQISNKIIQMKQQDSSNL